MHPLPVLLAVYYDAKPGLVGIAKMAAILVQGVLGNFKIPANGGVCESGVWQVVTNCSFVRVCVVCWCSPKKVVMSGGKRSTMGFDHLDGDRREFEPVGDQPDALNRHPYPPFPPSPLSLFLSHCLSAAEGNRGGSKEATSGMEQ